MNKKGQRASQKHRARKQKLKARVKERRAAGAKPASK